MRSTKDLDILLDGIAEIDYEHALARDKAMADYTQALGAAEIAKAESIMRLSTKYIEEVTHV